MDPFVYASTWPPWGDLNFVLAFWAWFFSFFLINMQFSCIFEEKGSRSVFLILFTSCLSVKGCKRFSVKPYSAFACQLRKNNLDCIYFTMYTSKKGCLFHIFGVVFLWVGWNSEFLLCIDVLIQNCVYVSMNWKSNSEYWMNLDDFGNCFVISWYAFICVLMLCDTELVISIFVFISRLLRAGRPYLFYG